TKSSAPIDDSRYDFEWPVDQHGYEIEHVPARETGLGTILSGGDDAHDVIRARGGPPRYYRPMEHPGLWRRFAETDGPPDRLLGFVSEFGLLGEAFGSEPPKREPIERIFNTAHLLRFIAYGLDTGDRVG